jgi:small subunit ribosomal protein S15
MAIYDKASVISENRRNDKDTGSADVQVAILTTRINLLTDHLKKSSKDHSSRRGLITMVSKRRKLLDYLNRTDKPRYESLIKKLNIRK